VSSWIQFYSNLLPSERTVFEGLPLGTRNQSLDVLRALAVLLVMGRHFPYYALWGRVGWNGVDLFFVLSGFLISGLLFQEYKRTGMIDFWRFMFRRGLKIWPPLYVFLMAMATAVLLSHQAFPRGFFAAAAGFYMNYFLSAGVHNAVPTTSYLVTHTWSLAVEEHFYVFLPLLLVVLIKLRRDFRFIPLIFSGLAAVSLALRVATHPTESYATHLRIDGLFAGVALGYLYHFKPSSFQRLTKNYVLLIWISTMLLPVSFPWESRVMQTVGISCLSIGFSLLIAWASVRTANDRVSTSMMRGLAGIGFYSYSIYLWHAPIAVLFRFKYLPSTISFWAYIVAATSIGIGMARVIEQPALSLRDKWYGTRFRPPLAAAYPAPSAQSSSLTASAG
jgi:peptidoglycan/LPS O-acetylase OafA/YrhL